MTELAELAAVPPGPALSRLLWSIDPRTCTASERAELLRAQYRQVCAEYARLLLIVDTSEPSTVDGSASTAGRDGPELDLGGVLNLSRGAVHDLRAMATTSRSRVPALHQAMLAGDVDPPKMRMLSRELADVDDAAAVAIVEDVLPSVAQKTIGRLRYAVRRSAERFEPRSVRDRVRRSQSRRAVRHDTTASGTASLGGVHLPLEDAAAAWDNVNAIAVAALSSGRAVGRTLDQVRADVFLGLLTGDSALDDVATRSRRRAGRGPRARGALAEATRHRSHGHRTAGHDHAAGTRGEFPGRLPVKGSGRRRRGWSSGARRQPAPR